MGKTTVQKHLVDHGYPTGVKISDTELAAVPINPHDFHGEWSYTLNAQTDTS